MDKALPFQSQQSVGNAPHDPQGLLDREPMHSLEFIGNRPAGQIVHHNEIKARRVVKPGIMNRDKRRIPNSGKRPHLSGKARPGFTRTFDDLPFDDLDRGIDPKCQMACEVNLTRSAGTNLSKNYISAKRRANRQQFIVHPNSLCFPIPGDIISD